MSTEDPAGGRRPWQTERAWAQLSERIAAADAPLASTSARRPSWLTAPVTRYSSVAAVLIGVATALVLRAPQRAQAERLVTTAPGERVTIHLADSSVVTLGPASSLRYVLSDSLRSLALVGLADFHVTHDARRPFVVRARNAETVDLGTEFVVRAYPEDSAVMVTVASGSVSVRAGSHSAQTPLTAGAVGRVASDGTVTLDRPADASLNAAWVDGRMAFSNQTVAAVALELSRTFDVSIRISDTTLSRRRVSGVYPEPSLTSVLDAVTAALDARYERNGRVITVSPRRR